MLSPYVVVNDRTVNPGQAGLLRHAATESAETAESALATLLLALLTTLLLSLVIFLFLVIGKE